VGEVLLFIGVCGGLVSRVVCGLRGLRERESERAISPTCVESFPVVLSVWQGKYKSKESTGVNTNTHRQE